MQVSRDKLNDMGEPILADGGDNVDRDLILDVLPVAVVGDLASGDFAEVRVVWVHNCFILLCFVCRFGVSVVDDVKFSASVIDVLVPYDTSFYINVEAFTARGEVSADSVTD